MTTTQGKPVATPVGALKRKPATSHQHNPSSGVDSVTSSVSLTFSVTRLTHFRLTQFQYNAMVRLPGLRDCADLRVIYETATAHILTLSYEEKKKKRHPFNLGVEEIVA